MIVYLVRLGKWLVISNFKTGLLNSHSALGFGGLVLTLWATTQNTDYERNPAHQSVLLFLYIFLLRAILAN